MLLICSFQGILLTCNSTTFTIGSTVNCTCTSDLYPTSVHWYKGNDSLSICSQNVSSNRRTNVGSASTIVIPSTDDHGRTLTCITDTPYGSQQASIDMEVEGNCNIDKAAT